MTDLHPYYFMHAEHGYIVTYDEMMEIMHNEYDADDTNICDWEEYFVETILRIDELQFVDE